MRLRPLVIALAGWAAFQGLSVAAETPIQSPGKDATPARAYFAVIGEVAHPGTYEAPGVWTLAELIKRAGGITPRANRTVHIFHGGVLTQQLYLGSGADPSLVPGDLIVAAGASDRPQAAVIDATRRPAEASTAVAVQIAFVNLIERPVVVKMPTDQATLSRIVELLGQSTDCASKIRIFSPLGNNRSESETADQTTRPLASGTVLVFPSSSIRVAGLPALPAPIAAESPAPQPAAARLPEFNVVPTNPSDTKAVVASPVQHKVHLKIEDDEAPKSTEIASGRSSEIAAPAAAEPGIRPLENRPSPVEATLMRSAFANEASESPVDRHPGRTVAIMAAMSAVAGGAMLLTIISIVQRWLQSGKPPLQKLWNANSKATAGSNTAVIPIPPISTRSIARRPVRIDAGQPITRLSVDLAAMERAKQAKSNR